MINMLGKTDGTATVVTGAGHIGVEMELDPFVLSAGAASSSSRISTLGVPPAASLDADRCAPGRVVQRVVVTRGDNDGRPSQGGWTPGVPRADGKSNWRDERRGEAGRGDEKSLRREGRRGDSGRAEGGAGPRRRQGGAMAFQGPVGIFGTFPSALVL